ncbi:aldose epimerase family protein [uncultured Pontibacter sp.]|uniref:aldose epimerase family protein n=1 Tax=uncultured Pontibacter sp. TaxID=453356 RepID=UPI0026124588|nr:aldose epimerase family protein [uncultured Pontibacter sp.]
MGRYIFWVIALLLLSGSFSGCGSNYKNASETSGQTEMSIQKEPFGTAPTGEKVWLYTLKNAKGMQVQLTNYGAIVTSIITPDKYGKYGDVALGFKDVSGYIPNEPHIGGIIGRFANRIANGKFTLAGNEYTLAKNDAPNHLHGGNIGFDRVVWQAEALPKQNAVRLTYKSQHLEEGYPGNLAVAVTYYLTEGNALKINYEATTDMATPVNLTNHSYFNLSAGQEPDILKHIVQLNADTYTATDSLLIPTGEFIPVKGTPYDFTTPHPVGARINNLQGYGYDLNYVINNGGNNLTHAATVYEASTGRVLEVHTTQPGIQLYTGYHLKGDLTGKSGIKYKRYAGLCLEAQHFPDSPNQPNFPSTILQPGERYQETTIYTFKVREEK